MFTPPKFITPSPVVRSVPRTYVTTHSLQILPDQSDPNRTLILFARNGVEDIRYVAYTMTLEAGPAAALGVRFVRSYLELAAHFGVQQTDPTVADPHWYSSIDAGEYCINARDDPNSPGFTVVSLEEEWPGEPPLLAASFPAEAAATFGAALLRRHPDKAAKHGFAITR